MAEMLRYNTGKRRLSLVPTSLYRLLIHNLNGRLVEETCKVLEFGAEKYSPNNWRTSGSWVKVFDSALRHCVAYATGEDTDSESGLHHLGHLGCNLAFLLEFEEQSSGVDDRYKVTTNKNVSMTSRPGFQEVLVCVLAALDGGSIRQATLALDSYMEGLRGGVITAAKLAANAVTSEKLYR